MTPRFHWTTFDIGASLPAGWQDEIRAVADDAEFREFPRTPVLTREDPAVPVILRGRVHASAVHTRLPWLYDEYRGMFLELARATLTEDVTAARDDRYGIVLNVQRGLRMRFECHVDSNPLTGLLFCSDHVAGGELVFAGDAGASGIASVERECSVIRPQAGHVIFFDGREHPHYARALADASGTRVVAVMNFYTGSCPESTRPRELNTHLYGDALGYSARGRDGPAAEHGVAGVEHRRLAGRHAAGGRAQLDPERAVV